MLVLAAIDWATKQPMDGNDAILLSYYFFSIGTYGSPVP